MSRRSTWLERLRRPTLLTLLCFAPFLSADGQRPPAPQATPAYFGEALPGETPVPFAAEKLDALSPWVAGTVFSPDGTQFFASVGTADYSGATLYSSTLVNGAWTPFVEPSFLSNFAYSNEPVFSADGTTLTFTGRKASGSLDLWTVRYTNLEWGTPIALPAPINSAASEYRGSYLPDGTLYFTSVRSGMTQVFKAYRDAAQSLVVDLVGPPISTRSFEGDPCIAPDGRFLIFSSGRDRRSFDLYVSFREGNGGWGPAIPLGDGFNTSADEYGAHLSADGQYVFFTRHTAQRNHIYWVAVSAIDRLQPQSSSGRVPPAAAYFGQTPPGETPARFAPGILAANPFLGPLAFSPDGTECFFTVDDASYTTQSLYVTRYSNGAWTPQALAPFVAGFDKSAEAYYSPDGNRLYFTAQARGSASRMDLWMVDRSGQGWGTPVRLPAPINSDANEFHFSEGPDGTIYFLSNRSGTPQIYRARQSADGSFRVELIPAPFLSVGTYDGDPSIAPDGRFLAFHSGRAGGFGAVDLHVSFADERGEWTRPINLGADFNTAADEYGTMLSPDGKYLFFVRHTPQKGEIFWVSTRALDRLAAQQPAP